MDTENVGWLLLGLLLSGGFTAWLGVDWIKALHSGVVSVSRKRGGSTSSKEYRRADQPFWYYCGMIENLILVLFLGGVALFCAAVLLGAVVG